MLGREKDKIGLLIYRNINELSRKTDSSFIIYFILLYLNFVPFGKGKIKDGFKDDSVTISICFSINFNIFV